MMGTGLRATDRTRTGAGHLACARVLFREGWTAEPGPFLARLGGTR